jgi:hypothetical protein
MTTANPSPDSERGSRVPRSRQRQAGAARIVRPLNIGYRTINDFIQLPLALAAAPGFCQAMQVEISGEVNPTTWRSPRRRWHDFPWVTPIVGSGAAGLPDGYWSNADRLHELVSSTLNAAQHVPAGANTTGPAPLTNWFRASPDTIVRRFLDSLRMERAGIRKGPVPAGPAGQPVSEFVAGLVLAAAQLTRVFHKMCLEEGRPLARWATDQVRSARTQAVDDEVQPLLAVIDFAQQRLPHAPPTKALGEPFQQAVATLLTGIRNDLLGGQDYIVRLEPLRQLTDLAWQSLVWDTCGSAYPGWTELLLDLVLLQEARRAPQQRRPRWHALNDLSSQIAHLIRPASLAAWDESRQAHRAGQASPTREFYDTTATLLWRQAAAAGRIRAGHPGTGGKLRLSAAVLPHTVAFVTSFDLELEMALVRSRPADQRFISVVMPVYLWWQDTDEGEFFWLEGVIQLPDADASSEQVVRALTRPVRWRAMYEGRYDLPDHPVIVRLTGSPLVDLTGAQLAAAAHDGVDGPAEEESLSVDLSKLDLKWESGRSEFVHSATVDEYLALRQAEAEYFWVYSRSTFANIHNRALPKALLACREPGPVRFWLVVGVPFKDPAVRLRVLSQMSSRRFMLLGDGDLDADGHSGGGVRAPGHDIAGLAVNWRLDDEEAVLLISLGMQVISDGRAEELTPHLRHYSWHLEAFAAGAAPRGGRQHCPEPSLEVFAR